ncbi:MAG TPA: hypothetical protein PKN32_10775 [Bacteroidales bacterium]|nr:hypothetical protein [Bacteroidales bacterium]
MIATLIILILNLSLILKSKNVIKYFFGILAIASILVFIIPEFEYTRTAMDRFNNLNLQSETNELYDLNGRQYYWSLALIELNNNLWGYGHTYFINKYDMSTHNEYLGQLVAIGVLPSIIYFIFIFRCLYQSYKQYKTNLNPLLIICILFISIYLIIGITENVSLANRRWILCLFFIMGMNTSILYKPRPNTLD